jgi:hypothetical protein
MSRILSYKREFLYKRRLRLKINFAPVYIRLSDACLVTVHLTDTYRTVPYRTHEAKFCRYSVPTQLAILNLRIGTPGDSNCPKRSAITKKSKRTYASVLRAVSSFAGRTLDSSIVYSTKLVFKNCLHVQWNCYYRVWVNRHSVWELKNERLICGSQKNCWKL